VADHKYCQKYGPVVRIGPNRVAVADPASVLEIYRTHNFRKGEAYSALTFGGAENSWNTSYVIVCERHPLNTLISDHYSLVKLSDPAFHDRLRRWTAPAFRGDNLRAAGRALEGEMGALVRRILHDSQGGAAVNVLRLFRLVSLDV